MNANEISRVSLFANALRALLEETNFFDRKHWAGFFRVSQSAVSQWLHDKTIPRADLLWMLVDVLRTRGGGAAAAALANFDTIAALPAEEVSPLGRRMLPTVAEYMRGATLSQQYGDLRNLPADERRQLLREGSWGPIGPQIETGMQDGTARTLEGPQPLAAFDPWEAVTGSRQLDLDVLTLFAAEAGRAGERRPWIEFAKTKRCLILGTTGCGKSTMMRAWFEHLTEQKEPVFMFSPATAQQMSLERMTDTLRSAAQRSVVFIDALDEFPLAARQAILDVIAAQSQETRFVVASHQMPALENLQGFERIAPAPLTIAQIVMTLQNVISQTGTPKSELRRFLCHLSESPPLMAAFGTPLFLRVGWTLFEQRKVTPFWQAAITRECIDVLFEYAKEKGLDRIREPWAMRQQLELLLTEMSFRLVSTGSCAFTEDDVASWIGGKHPSLPAKELLDLIEMQGFVESRKGDYIMPHAFIRDYFAGQYLGDSVRGSEGLFAKYADQQDFREVVRLACSTSNDATSLLNDLSEHDTVPEVLSDVLAQPLSADPRAVEILCGKVVGWLGKKLEGMHIETSTPSSFLTDWQLSARTQGRRGSLGPQDMQSVMHTLEKMQKARSCQSKSFYLEKLEHNDSEVLPAFARRMNIDIAIKVEPQVGGIRARATEMSYV